MTYTIELKYCPKCGGELVRAQIAGRERLVCADQACGYVFWDNPTPTLAAVV
jgi:ribosomal protein S27AE